MLLYNIYLSLVMVRVVAIGMRDAQLIGVWSISNTETTHSCGALCRGGEICAEFVALG